MQKIEKYDVVTTLAAKYRFSKEDYQLLNNAIDEEIKKALTNQRKEIMSILEGLAKKEKK